ncbi:MAG: hypothetical protein AAFU77_05845 [Myxococcota bacterium]
MKAQIRQLETLTRKTFGDAVAHAMNQISESNVFSWIRHAGYVLAPA